MPRARNIKPGFFDNSELGKLPSDIRLLYIALWTLSDRDGVLEYDAAVIRRYVFGYKPEITEEMINGYLTVLSRLDNQDSVVLKEYNNKKYIVLLKFPIHQNPHHTEKKGRLPELSVLKSMDNIDLTVTSPLSNVINPADSLIPNSLIPDSPPPEDYTKEFEQFKMSYPLQGRGFGSIKDAKAKFIVARKKDTFTNIMIGVNKYASYIRNTGQDNKDAFRWIEKEQWRDDYSILPKGITNHNYRTKPTADDNWTAGTMQFLSENAE